MFCPINSHINNNKNNGDTIDNNDNVVDDNNNINGSNIDSR